MLSDRPAWTRAVALVGATAATEAVVLRVSSGLAVPGPDLVALVAVGAIMVGGIVLAAAHSERAGAVMAGLPTTLAAMAVSVPVVMDFPGAGPFVGVLVLLSAVLGLRTALRAVPRWLGPRAAIASLLAMVGLTWAVEILSQGHSPQPWQAAGLGAGAVLLLGLGRWAGLAIPLVLIGGPSPEERWTADGPVPDGPDVVLLTVDTLRADHAANMEVVARIASDGVVLEGQAASPWTLPSMATLMTGLEPHHHGAGRDAGGAFHGLAPEIPTLAATLAAAGWDTAATIENPFVGSAFGVPRGFARVREIGPLPFALPKQPLSDRSRLWEASLASLLGMLPPLPDGADRHVADVADFLARRRDRPLLLWVHLVEPHLPYHHAIDLDIGLGRRLALATLVRQAEDQPPPENLAELRLAYDHEVQVADRALCAVLDLLGPPPARGRIVVFTADHGEEFGEHEGWEHGHSMFQELLAVPLVIGGIEGVEPGRAGLVDVAPTVLAAVGLAGQDLDGRDLAGGPTTVIRSSAPLYGPVDLRAVLAGDRKAIGSGEGITAYDLRADPGEQRPVRVDPILEALLPPPYAPTGAAEDVDPATRARLRSLGYVDD
ncbi:MAG: hypothetical protein D6798_15465 [Deltaproteobacteria bacterium]|nr:MAG: hypothetical protein D6798_15465 [Deltaproteobacteria bacterium]